MTHYDYLQQALTLAQQRQGFCAPNPSVGAVLVQDGNIIGQGNHHQCGEAHAEVVALRQAGEQARGATAYVTLEPCCHHGRTPPCTEALISAGVTQVIYGHQDSNPQVAGRGAQALRNAGISCEYLPQHDITDFYRSYDFWRQSKRPWLTMKMAMSLDGVIAAANGQPLSISGPELAEFTHQQRSRSDSLLTTSNTIINDNPRFDCRTADATYKKPLYVLDSQLRTPLHARIFEHSSEVILLHAESAPEVRLLALQQHGARCVTIPSKPRGLDLHAALAIMGEHGQHHVWAEVGAHCFQQIMMQQLAQRVFLYVAPTWLGPDTLTIMSEGLQTLPSTKIAWSSWGKDALCDMCFV